MVKVFVYQLKEEAREYWFMGSIMGKNCIYRESKDGIFVVPQEMYKYIGTVELEENQMSDEEYAELVYTKDQFGECPQLHIGDSRTTSTSDVFIVARKDTCCAYFVDSIGWIPIDFMLKEDWEKLRPMEKGKIRNL